MRASTRSKATRLGPEPAPVLRPEGRIAFTVTLAPRTKKNHGRVRWSFRLKRKVHVPSEAWDGWVAGAEIVFPDLKAAKGFIPGRTILWNVNCRALFYQDADRQADPVGYYQGLADLLQAKGVIANDRQIRSWDGSRLLIDRKNPRTEVVLETTEA